MRVALDTRAFDKIVQGPERHLSREAYALLAQANLLRIRGDWPEATEKCMAALRLSPDNPSAQSLLGDIYENQGRLDDAIQWYRMALDVQPDSPADQIKLARLLDLKARDLTPQSFGKPLAPPVPGPAPLPEPPQRWRTDPEKVLRHVASVAGALAILVVCLALVLVHRSGAVGAHAGVRQVDVPPVVVPSLVAAPTAGVPTSPSPAAGDPAETALLTALQASQVLKDKGAEAASVTIDPRIERLTVTITCRPPESASQSRDLILEDVTLALQTTARQAEAASVTLFTVRCLIAPSAGGSTPLLFTADTTRPALAALSPDLSQATAAQLRDAYTNPWWTSALGQSQ